MIVLSPGQQAKIWRLKAQERTIHATLQTFRERRADLVARMRYVDQQVDMESSRGKPISEVMRDEIELMKAPIARELAALAAEEAAVTGQWRQAAQLMQALDKYVQGAGRSN